MGTSSSTVVYDEFNRPILNLHGQHDGYFEGHGIELVDFLKDKKIVNGINTKDGFNGIECAAASIVAHFKTGIGDYYIHHPNIINGDYIYEVYEENNRIVVDMTHRFKTTRIL